MKTSRYSVSRQKACLNCAAAKAKCHRQADGCLRCAQRRLSCTNSQTLPSRGSAPDSSPKGDGRENTILVASDTWNPPASEVSLPSRQQELSTGVMSESLFPSSSTAPMGDYGPINIALETTAEDPVSHYTNLGNISRLSRDFDNLDFSNPDLCCPINADDISNRWLNPYLPLPGQKIKQYPVPVANFIYWVLKSYVSISVRGRGAPPFVHASQTTPTSTSMRPPLSTCLALVRSCECPLPGSENSAAAVLQREMDSLYEQMQHGSCNNLTLLSAFQAYLIYSMVLFFQLDLGGDPCIRQAMMNLQSLASSSCRHGLVCTAEQEHARPQWECWIVAEAKRRTLYSMYLFDSVLSTRDGLPTFLGTELQGLPATSNKLLWKARARHEWEAAYHLHLTDWVRGNLCIDELWPSPLDLDEPAKLERCRRIDLWLENADEFGTMLYAVTSCTHGV